MRLALRWLAGVVAALGVLAAALMFVADTDVGHRFIVDRIAALKPASGLRVRIGRIDGSIYGEARLRGLVLSDPRGVFLEADDVTLDWNPAQWLSNRLDIDRLIAPSATLTRLPQFRPSGQRQPILPDFDIRIGAFLIERLTLGEGVVRPARTGWVAGRADIRDGRALVDLVVRAGEDRLALVLDAAPDRDRFDLDAALDAPAGGVFGKIIGTTLPVTVRIDGNGRWQAWQGRVRATASGRELVRAALTARSGRFDVDGVVRPSLVTRGKLAQLTGPSVRVIGNATLARRRLDTHLSLATDALAVGLNGIVDLGTSSFDGMRVDARLLRPQALLSSMRGQGIALKLLLDGPFRTARFDYLLTAPRVQFDRTGFERVRASGRGRLSPSPVIVPLALTAARVTGVGDVAGGILANLRVDGLLRVTPTLLTGDGLRVRSDKLVSTISVVVDFATGRYTVGLSGRLGRYFIPGLGIVDVTSRLEVVPGPGGRGTRVVGRGQAFVRRLDNSFLASLAGGLPRIDTALERGVDGIIRFTGLRLIAPQLTLTGNGLRRNDGTFYFEGSGRQARYGPLRLTLDGRIDRPRLDIRLARPLDSAQLSDVRLLLDPTAEGFAWRAAGGSALGPFTGQGAILLPRGGTTTIRIAGLEASGVQASGDLRIATGGFDGTLAIAGSGLSGTIALRPQNGVQRADVALTARDAELAGPPPTAIRRGRLNAVLLLDPRGTSVDATFEGQGLRRGTLSLARVASRVQLTGGTGTVTTSLAGSRGRGFDLQTVAQVSAGRIVLTAQGNVDRRPLRLTQPAVLIRTNAGWQLQPTALSFAGGTARVAGSFGGETIAVDATIERLPLSIADIFYPRSELGGSASGSFSFRQPADGSAPSGQAMIRVRGLTRSGLVLSSQPIDVGVNAVLSARGAAVRASAASGGQTIGQAQARLSPLAGTGALATRLANAPLFAQVRYNGPANTLWRLTGIESFDISGPVAVGADVGGRLADPVIRGSVRTESLRLESPLSGTVLTGIKASGRFGGSRLVIDSFTAQAGRGSVAGRASFDLAAARGFGIDIAANASNASLIARDDIAATVTGPIAIRSDGAGGTISGNVVLDRSAFRLGQATAAASVPQLRVREINRPADRAEVRAPTQPWRLDLTATAPNRLAVSGLGLDSEWRTDLKLGGTITAPAILGRADLVRGGYEFAGRRFELARGTIRFQGTTPPDPALDITANANVQGLNATIQVTGTGQRPVIGFQSVPALPQDELLSRLLFGTSITNLSAPEALQLAAAVAGLQGGGSGLNPINAVRQAVGLDRLRILPADTTIGQGTSVAAGKYIGRRTYVEIITDGQGYSATRVEFAITRWLSLLSSISTIGRQSAAVRVSRDY